MLAFQIGLLLATTPYSSITDSIADYKTLCIAAATSDEVFAEFKRHPVYQEALEISNYDLGNLFANKIALDYPILLPQIHSFQKNDLYGSPITYDFPFVGRFSPATLRYILIGADILNRFTFQTPPSIVEIGVGYGGQCLTLHSLLPITSYTLIDLPSVLPLVAKYLALFDLKDIECVIPNHTTPKKEYDLFISNYAFSECNRQIQLSYFKEIIQYSKRGYVLFNNISNSWEIDSLSLSEFIELLEAVGITPKVLPENPSTHPENHLIIWDRS